MRSKSIAVLLLVTHGAVLLSQAQEARPEVPRALRAFQESRRSVVSGDVKWSMQLGDTGRTHSFVNRYAANGDIICEYRGDPDGWVAYRAPANVGNSRFPVLLLSTDAGVWEHKETTIRAALWPKGEELTNRPPPVKDYRLAGVCSTSGTIEHALADRHVPESENDPIHSYEEDRDGNLVRVRANHGSGATTEWLLDPDRGYNALSIVSQTPKGGEAKMEADVERVGDLWLPTRITYSRRGKVEATVKLESAALNSPTDALSFSPADIGIEPGMAVADQRQSVLGSIGQADWNGEAIVPHGEFVADVEAGRLAPGPTVRATWDRGYFDSPHLTDEDRKRIELATSKGVISRALVPTTLWQRYVERFILKYELNDEQAQRARRVLADCDAAAEKVARKTEARWNETQAKLKEAIEASDGKRALALRNEIKTLNEPIEKSFEDRLKPGLEKIPTRAQRQKADAADPADKPRAKPAARP